MSYNISVGPRRVVRVDVACMRETLCDLDLRLRSDRVLIVIEVAHCRRDCDADSDVVHPSRSRAM